MTGKYDRYLSFRIPTAVKARLERVLAALRAKPPEPPAGRPTVQSVASAALLAGLDVLEQDEGIATGDSETAATGNLVAGSGENGAP